MKKTFTVLLTIYLTIATVAAVVFGWLYFGGLKNEGFSFNAKALVERVYNDLGFNKAVLNTGSTSADSLDYEDFTSGDLMEESWGNAEVASIYHPITAKLHLSMVKSVLGCVPTDFDQNAIYKSQITYVLDENDYHRDTYYAKITVTEDSVLASIAIDTANASDAQSFPEAKKPTPFNTWHIKVQQTSKLGWKLSSYVYYKADPDNYSYTGGSGYVMSVNEFTAAADENGKLYQMGMVSIGYTNPTEEIKEPKVEGQTILNGFVFVDANTQTKKKIKVQETENVTDPEIVATAETRANEIISAVAVMPDLGEQSETVEKDFANKIFEECWIGEGINAEKLS